MADDIKKIQDIIKKAEEYAERKAKKSKKPKLSHGAFWISPKGDIRVVKAGSYHINDAIQNPEVFGWNSEDINSLYDEYGERLGQEGSARDNLMTSLLKDGWVRVRIRKNFYSIQVWDFTPNSMNRIENFISSVIEDGINGHHATVHDDAKINALKTGKMKSISFGEILKGHLYEAQDSVIDMNYFNR